MEAQGGPQSAPTIPLRSPRLEREGEGLMPQATSVARGRKEGKGSPGEEQQSSAAGEVGRGHWNGDLFVDGSGYEPTMP